MMVCWLVLAPLAKAQSGDRGDVPLADPPSARELPGWSGRATEDDAAEPGSAEPGAAESGDDPRAAAFIKDESWVRILGKALFWDTVADGHTACAACHFNAAADRNIPDQMQARPLVRAATTDGAESSDRNSWGRDDWDTAAQRDSIEACGDSFLTPAAEISDRPPPPAGAASRRTQFDVRFFGNAGPASCGQRNLLSRTRELLATRPLEARTLRSDDSLFGSDGPHGNLISSSGRGLDRTYTWLIQQAFNDSLWKRHGPEADPTAADDSRPDPSAIEQRFPLFRALAVIAYESTLPARHPALDSSSSILDSDVQYARYPSDRPPRR